MSDILEMANAYYKVAADMRARALEGLRISDMLSAVADRMCEENMKQQSEQGKTPNEGQ